MIFCYVILFWEVLLLGHCSWGMSGVPWSLSFLLLMSQLSLESLLMMHDLFLTAIGLKSRAGSSRAQGRFLVLMAVCCFTLRMVVASSGFYSSGSTSSWSKGWRLQSVSGGLWEASVGELFFNLYHDLPERFRGRPPEGPDHLPFYCAPQDGSVVAGVVVKVGGWVDHFGKRLNIQYASGCEPFFFVDCDD